MKEVIFVKQDAAAEYAAMSAAVRESADARITILQNCGRLPSRQVQSLRGALAGVSEIRVPFNKDTYRVYFAAQFEKVIYLLDAGMKKSAQGGELAQ